MFYDFARGGFIIHIWKKKFFFWAIEFEVYMLMYHVSSFYCMRIFQLNLNQKRIDSIRKLMNMWKLTMSLLFRAPK